MIWWAISSSGKLKLQFVSSRQKAVDYGWLGGFYGISNLCRLFNTKSIFMQKQFSLA